MRIDIKSNNMMETQTKYLVTIEFRYRDFSEKFDRDTYESKAITIGVFETIKEAIIEGNKALEIFEKHFKLNIHWNKKERFSENGGCFGSVNNLVTNTAYLQTPFDFYAKITKLKYEEVEDTILEVLEATKRYNEYIVRQKEE